MALDEPIKVFNIDGTRNKRGTITHYTELDLLIGEQIKKTMAPHHRIRETKSLTWIHLATERKPRHRLETRKD